jgi:hypothetical protein
MKLKTSTYLQLSFMMFLEYAIWGVWYVTLGNYLTSIGFQGTDVGKAYSTMAWGSIAAAFFVSLIADKYFAAQKLTGILHLVAGLLMFWVSRIHEPNLFFWVLLLYMIFYMPTIALTNAIAFRHTPEAGKQFPRIRVLGTIGWIAAGITISITNIELGPYPMVIAAVLSILMGIYSFTLPDTPPKAVNVKITVKDISGHRCTKTDEEPFVCRADYIHLAYFAAVCHVPPVCQYVDERKRTYQCGRNYDTWTGFGGNFYDPDAFLLYQAGDKTNGPVGDVCLGAALPAVCLRKRCRVGFILLYRYNPSWYLFRFLLCYSPDLCG